MSAEAKKRTARSREAILQAALDLNAERGYAAVGMDAIATRARVGKPTLYRWWPSKGALYLDVLQDRVVEPYIVWPDTGDFVADLHTWIRGFAEMFSNPDLRQLLIGVVGTAQHDPDLARLIRERIHAPQRAKNLERITAAQQAGQLPRLDPGILEELLVAPQWYRLLVSGEPFTVEYADTLVAIVLGLNAANGS
ncbi:TetR/AcrR family transcriptional regulator [Nocardia panacis]|uniref:TetR/AcrR family transcriptional regulator n=1 Tax=Nocardia panacis TaxID=2340916 RepID=UPI00193A4B63|nr:TetR/AcrR family transcriptional regulator [Nocardia panacis]